MLSCRRCISNEVADRQVEKAVETQSIQSAETLQEALKHDDYFNVRNLVTLKDLFHNNAHLGHNKGCRNVYMTPYLFGTRSDIDIIDLEQTVPLFQDALNFTAHIAYRGGIILFVSRSKGMMPYVEKTAEVCGEYAHCRHWIGGVFTNAHHAFGQKVRLPDLVILLNTLDGAFQEHRAVVDSAKMLIPTVAIVDTNCDPRLITYPVPANDDTFKTMSYYLNLFETAILNGKRKRSSEVVSQHISKS